MTSRNTLKPIPEWLDSILTILVVVLVVALVALCIYLYLQFPI